MDFRDRSENLLVSVKDFESETLAQLTEELNVMAVRHELDEGDFRAEADGIRSRIDWLKTLNRESWAREVSNAFTLDELSTRLKEIESYRKREKKRFGFIAPAPTNAQIDLEEQNVHHFAQGLHFYKLFWLFLIGSFLGVVLEMVWVVVIHGHFEYRSGLVLGPFNIVYGIGAAVMSATLYRFRNWSRLFSFVGGAVAGCCVEYACSLFQELVFGSTSWDYSHLPFNINGRVCLLYSLFWGFLGVLWIKDIYPRLSRWILKIPNRFGKGLTWVLVLFMCANILFSALAVLRWGERIQSEPATTRMDRYLDAHFGDEVMETIYAGMAFVSAGQEHDDSRFAR